MQVYYKKTKDLSNLMHIFRAEVVKGPDQELDQLTNRKLY